MKVKDLIKKLENVNPEMLVFCTSNRGEYEYCLVNSAQVSELSIRDIDKTEEEEVDVFLIDEQ